MFTHVFTHVFISCPCVHIMCSYHMFIYYVLICNWYSYIIIHHSTLSLSLSLLYISVDSWSLASSIQWTCPLLLWMVSRWKPACNTRKNCKSLWLSSSCYWNWRCYSMSWCQWRSWIRIRGCWGYWMRFSILVSDQCSDPWGWFGMLGDSTLWIYWKPSACTNTEPHADQCHSSTFQCSHCYSSSNRIHCPNSTYCCLFKAHGKLYRVLWCVLLFVFRYSNSYHMFISYLLLFRMSQPNSRLKIMD